MQVLSRWRISVIFEPPIAQSIRIAATANPLTTYWASFHSTDAWFDKWKPKFKVDVGSNHQPTKNCIRYAVRQKRADTKKALKNLLFNCGCPTTRPEISFSKIEADYGDQLDHKSGKKPVRQARRACHKKMKRKHRRENSCEDFDEYPERIFEATYGKRWFEWTFKPWEMGYDWKETSGWSKSTYREHGAKSRIESDDESFNVGSFSDKRVLGLPTAGPLKIEDVKSAFRQSALKWHPDKHQGPSQADAEEKFKNCANAYKSLCTALAAA
ncbi:Chaperone DnaJ-domain superfamily protein [Dorcoceras hygrometricum]|uniref:Chaperone DnaJ-domain superfamily protein n=1 Tax=Dorcoceras hygrometricum TaxID=472368 RepID=A0A2Z7ALG2_9LAMI|nr:Chaperone DnaJ-domain superfamily protein [Dorcoceras hygrometricum]